MTRNRSATPVSEAVTVSVDGDTLRNQVDAFTAPGSRANKALIARAGGMIASGLAGIVVLSTLVSPGSWDSHGWWLFLGSIAAASGLVLATRPLLLPLPLLDAMSVGAAIGTCALAIDHAPTRAALPFILLPLNMMAHGVRRWWVSAMHTVTAGLGYACVLVWGPPQPAPAARWFAVMVSIVSSGLFIRWLVVKIRELVIAESEARVEAEVISAELAAASESKSRFLARMSHELRTPLNAVVGFADVLKEGFGGKLGDRQRGYVEDIADAGKHLLSLVDDVLDLTKVEAGDLRLEPSEYDLRRVVEDAARMVRERAVRNRIQLRLDIAVRNAVVVGDERKIRQVVVNLLANALRFTAPGGRVAVSLDGDAKWLRVAVRDTGIGIPGVDLERIFIEFEQVDGRSGGTGLGLPLARRYAEAHGGRLEVVSREGVGSVFTMHLPRRSMHADAAGGADDAVPLSVDYEAFTVPGSAASQAMLAQIGSWWCVCAAIVGPVLALLLPGSVAGRALMAGVCLLTLVAVPLQRRLPKRPTPKWSIVLLGDTGVLMISAVGLIDSPLRDVAPVLYGWVVVTTFALWSTWRGISQLAVIGLAYAGVLWLHPSDPMAPVRWVAVIGGLVLLGGVINWLARTLRQLVHAEREARLRTEAVGTRLALASRHKSEFLASMSHELRTPLNAIIGFSDVLIELDSDALTRQQREYVIEIGDAGRRLLVLINDILDLAKLNAGQLLVAPEPVVVADVVERAVRAAQSELGGAAILSLVPDDLPLVHADPARLCQVLEDLLVCAARLTDQDGTVELDAKVAGDVLRLDVRTVGGRLVSPSAERLVEALRGAPDAALAADGSGLSLALAKGLTELHGGSIEVTATAEGDTVLRVSLPAATSELAMP